jgi:hypothetical protein
MSTARYAELHAPRIASLRHGDLQTYGRGVRLQKEKLVHGMVERGYTPEFAQRTFAQLEGFGSYDMIPGKPRGFFCAHRLCLLLAQMPSPGCLLRGSLERTADGFLCPCSDRPRCARA